MRRNNHPSMIVWSVAVYMSHLFTLGLFNEQLASRSLYVRVVRYDTKANDCFQYLDILLFY